jgi:ferredoxin
MPTVTLVPSGLSFEAVEGQTILQAALAAGIEMPRSCRNGTCRSCRCVVAEGKTRHTIEWPGLSRDEIAEGWILPCVCHALTDVVVIVPDVAR